MLTTKLHIHSPSIALNLEELIGRIENLEDCILVIQLDYRDTNTIFNLDKVSYINFDEDYIEIRQENNNTTFLYYQNILEYNILNTNDLLDFGEEIYV